MDRYFDHYTLQFLIPTGWQLGFTRASAIKYLRDRWNGVLQIIDSADLIVVIFFRIVDPQRVNRYFLQLLHSSQPDFSIRNVFTRKSFIDGVFPSDGTV